MIITKLIYALANQCVTWSELFANTASRLDHIVQQRIKRYQLAISEIIG